MPVVRPPNQNETFVPGDADVAATRATLAAAGIDAGNDTAAVVTRRTTIETAAAAYRAGNGSTDLPLCDLLDAIIAAVFDA